MKKKAAKKIAKKQAVRPSPLPKDPELYRKALYLRAEKNFRLGALARELNISSRRIREFLDEATKWLVQENRRLTGEAPPKRERSPIETRLLERFRHLKDVFVVPGDAIREAHQYEALTARWGAMAAAFLDRRIDDAAASGKEVRICMSGGDTILEFVNSLPIRERLNVFFYASALIGRSSTFGVPHVDAIATTTIAWSRSKRIAGGCSYATVTPYDLSDATNSYEGRRRTVQEDISDLLRHPLIKKYLATLNEMDIAIAGVGTVRDPHIHGLAPRRVTATNLLERTARITADDLEADNVVGEIGYCYFGAKGDGNSKWHFYLTAGDGHRQEKWRGVGFYRQMVDAGKDVVVMAGAFKEDALIAALDGKLFNIWFTNDDSAERILKAAGPA